MNSFKTSSGERITKGRIDRNIRRAKEIKARTFKNDNAFIYCEKCEISQGAIDISHIISVKYCQETGRANLSWDQKNLRFLCRACHNKHDALPNKTREMIFEQFDLPF